MHCQSSHIVLLQTCTCNIQDEYNYLIHSWSEAVMYRYQAALPEKEKYRSGVYAGITVTGQTDEITIG